MQKRKVQESFPGTHNGDTTIVKKRKKPATTDQPGKGVSGKAEESIVSHSADGKSQKAERQRLKKTKEIQTAALSEQGKDQDTFSEHSQDAILRHIKLIEEEKDLRSSLLKSVDGDDPKIEKAKKKRRKLLKKLAKGKADDDQAGKEASTYTQNPELASKSKADIDVYLTSNKITHIDPSSAKFLRPILDFTYLPADTRPQSRLFATFKSPTPIQAAAWPYVLSGRDVVGVAETGSGKTLAFGVPCVRRLYTASPTAKKHTSPARSVVVSPTRELAIQIYEQYVKLAKPNNFECVCVYGGVPKEPQRAALKSAHIIIATPGRLNDLISEGSADLSNVEYLVLDEADRMLDKGFEEDIRKIISACAPNSHRQTLMFTATWPPSVRSLAESFMRSPVQIRIGDDHSDEVRANTRIEQRVEVLDADPRVKQARLLELIRQFHSGSGKNRDRILVFALYKKEAVRIESFLQSKGLNVAGIHGDLSQERRTAALDGFKRGSTSILVATDVAARGLDIPDVKAVINVTFPLTIEDYVHRIGRTGRAGAEGLAITFFTQHDKGNSGALINVLKAAKQKVPEELLKFGTTVKKKEHSAYGAFYKAPVEGAKTATKITFDD